MMEKNIRKMDFTKQGKKEEGKKETLNEDCVYVCDDFGFVLDGATGLTKENITPEKSDARWFTQMFKQFLKKKLKNENDSIQDILKEGLTFVNNLYNSFEGANNIKSRPSSGIALFRINKNDIEFFVLGDCCFLVRDKKDNIKLLTTSELAKLDGINIKKMVQKAKEHNINVIEARELINDELLKTRLTQNTKKGYWILSDDLKAIDNGFYTKTAKSNITQIIAMSDGFSQIFDVFKLYTQKEFADSIKNGKSLETLYDELYEAQEKDKDCNNYPRFKTRDDASILDLEFK